MTILRDATTTRPDFIFYADRLSTLIVEHALTFLPHSQRDIVTGNGVPFTGIANCDDVSWSQEEQRGPCCGTHGYMSAAHPCAGLGRYHARS